MNGQRGRWAVLLVIVLGAALSLWLGDLYTLRPRGPAQEPGHVPESVLEDVRLVQYDLQGSVRYRLTSPRLVQFLDDKAIEAVTPYIELHTAGDAPVHVRAHHAWVSPQRDRLELRNGVDIQQLPAAGSSGFTAQTDRLLVLPHQQLARTDAPLLIRGRDFRLEGVGGQLLLAQGVLRLERRVRSRFWQTAPGQNL